MAKQYWAHKAKHQAQHLNRLRQGVQGALRERQARFVMLQSLRDRFRALRTERLMHHTAKRWIDDGARNEYAQEITALPHTLDFLVNQLKKLLCQIGSGPNLIAGVHVFFSYPMLDHGREQPGLALEITVDQAFRTAGRSGNFASGCYLITFRREKAQGGANKSLFLGSPSRVRLGLVPSPFSPRDIACLALLRARSLRFDIVFMPQSPLPDALQATVPFIPIFDVITLSIFCKKIVTNLSRGPA